MTSVFELIVTDEYIAYFGADDFALEHPQFTGFLRSMLETAQAISKNPQNPTPYDIIDAIGYKLKFDKLTPELVVEITRDERLQRLNAADLFVLLWYLVCRNFFDPKQTIYMEMAKNGTVGRLLSRLAELTA